MNQLLSWGSLGISAVLTALAFPGESFPNYSISLAIFISFIGVFFFIFRQKKIVNKVKGIWFMGCFTSFLTFHWIIEPTVTFGGVPLIASIALFAIYCAFSGFYYVFLFAPFFFKSPLILSALLSVGWELFSPRFFQWHLGYLIQDLSWLAQIHSYFGPGASTFILLLTQAYIAQFFITHHKKYLYKTLLIYTVATSLGYLEFQRVQKNLTQHQNSQSLKIGWIQPNFTFDDLANRSPLPGSQIMGLEPLWKMTDQLLSQNKVDLIIWPESVVPHEFTLSKEFVKQTFTLLQKFNTPLLLQATEWISHRDLYASSFIMYPNQTWSHFYRKWIPMPFGEMFPFEEWYPSMGELFREYVGNTSKVTVGHEATPLPIHSNVSLGTMICFDAISPDLGVALSLNNQILINQGNFVWMGKTNAGLLFSQIGRSRALENHRSLILVSNTGPTLAFDPLGRPIGKKTELLTQNSGVFEVPTYDEISFYARYGKNLMNAIILLSVLILGFRHFEKKKRSWMRKRIK